MSNSQIPKQRRRSTLAAMLVAVCLLVASPAAADRYDPQEAGHPLRIVAYVLHPVGVVLDLMLFRPAHWIASHEPITSLVGHEPYRD